MNPIVFVLLAAILIGIAFYVVALPLLQQARRNTAAHAAPAAGAQQERLAELLAQRDAAFQALRELNFDHRVGKITAEDFVAFEASLKQNAAETLRALDQWEAESDDADLDAVMERAIRSRKDALAGRAAEPDGRTCPQCGKAASAGDKFCGKCGASLLAVTSPAPTAVRPVCPKCGQPHKPGDKFCGKCGQPLAAEVAPAAR